MWLFRKRQGKTQAHPQIKTEEPTRPFEELCHPEDREQLEKIALDVGRFDGNDIIGENGRITMRF